MLGKKKKLISCLVVFALLLSATVAYASYTQYWGSSTSYTAGSNKARHASYMAVANSDVSARTVVRNDTGHALSPGWLGVRPIAYFSNGEMAKRGDWEYSDARISGMDVPLPIYNYKSYLYSKGETALWNGNGYTRRKTTPSPNAKAESARLAIEGIQINSSGETFGSELAATSYEDRPDLIAAVGVDGISGYVRKTDLDGDMPNSPEEAVKLMHSPEYLYTARVVPLYDSEGKKVIGEFEIGSARNGCGVQIVMENGVLVEKRQ